MKTLKRSLCTFGAAALAIGLVMLASPEKIQAQVLSDSNQINLRHPITVGGTTLQPGNYTVEPLSVAGGDAPVLMIYGDHGTKLETMAPIVLVVENALPRTRVLYYHVGHRYYFDQILPRGGGFGYRFHRPRSVKQLQSSESR